MDGERGVGRARRAAAADTRESDDLGGHEDQGKLADQEGREGQAHDDPGRSDQTGAREDQQQPGRTERDSPDAQHSDQIEDRDGRACQAGDHEQHALGEQEVAELARRTTASPDQAREGSGGDVRYEDGSEQRRLGRNTAGGHDRHGSRSAHERQRYDGEIGPLQRGPELGIP